MSHPFTLEYMQEGETSANNSGGNRKKRNENQEGSVAHTSRVKSRQSTRMSESESVTEGCQIDQIEENPDGDMEMIKDEMNITITDKERVSFFKILKMAMRRRMEIFAEEVSIVGLSYLFKPPNHKIGSIIRKVIWTMLLLFGVGFMVFQIYDRITYYLTYPTIVNYRVAYNRSLRFPTVTICSEAFFSKRAVHSIAPEAQNFASIRYPPFWSIEFGDSFKTMNLTNFDFDDWEFIYDHVSVKMKEAILECSFGNLPCNSNEVTKPKVSDVGYCLSFNPVTTNYVTTHPGANYGLRLVLWVNQSDSALIMSPGVGYKVVLHDPRDLPIVEEIGFRVGTGISASVSISLRNLSLLPFPYGDCREAENYTFMRCMGQCLGNYTKSKCGCRMIQFDVTGKVCSVDQNYNCVPTALKSWYTSGACRKCDCPLHCHQLTYPYSISTSPLSQHFLNYMSQKSQFKGRNLTMSKLSKELVFLDIFYSQLNYIDIQTTPAYNFLKLVCDIGGALGLILGGTLFTIVEFFQLFVQLFNELVTSARFAKMQRR